MPTNINHKQALEIAKTVAFNRQKQIEKEKEEKKKNQFESHMEKMTRSLYEKSIGFDTLDSDNQALMKKLKSNYDKVQSGAYIDPNETDALLKEAEALRKRMNAYNSFVSKYASDNADAIKNAKEQSEAYSEIYQSLTGQKSFYSNFKDANDYNAQMEAIKERDRLTNNYDLDANKKILEEKEKTLKSRSGTASFLFDRATRLLDGPAPSVRGTDKLKKGLKAVAAVGSAVANKAVDYDGLKSEYDKLLEEYNTAKWLQDDAAYEKLVDRGDFEKQSKKANSTWDVGDTARAADYINGKWYAKLAQGGDSAIDFLNILNDNEKVDRYKRYDLMTDDQVKTFNYIYNTEGQKKAQEYLDHIDNGYLQSLYADKNKSKNWLVNAYRALDSGFSKIGDAAETIGAAGLDLITRGYDSDKEIKKINAPSNNQLSLGARMQDAGKFENFTYDLLQSMPQSALAMIPGGAGFALQGLASGANAYADATTEGKNLIERLSMATASGLTEYTTNKIFGGIGASELEEFLSKATKKIPNIYAKNIAKYGIKSVSEAFEEGFQEVAETYLRNSIYGENNKVNWENVGRAALLGAASASIMNTPFAIDETVQDIKLPPLKNDSFKKSYDTSKSNDISERFKVFSEGFESEEQIYLAEALRSLQTGNTEGALKELDKGIQRQKYAKEYSQRNFEGLDTSDIFDEKIMQIEGVKDAIKSGKFNTEAAKTTVIQNSTIWQLGAQHNDEIASVLSESELSNNIIDKVILKDALSKKIFERETGTRLPKNASLAQQRKIVKNVHEAYIALKGDSEKGTSKNEAIEKAQKYLKSNNTVEDAKLSSENRTAAIKALNDEAMKLRAETDAERNKDKSVKDIHKIDVLTAEVKLLERKRDDIYKNNVLSFASRSGNTIINNTMNPKGEASTDRRTTVKTSTSVIESEIQNAASRLDNETREILAQEGTSGEDAYGNKVDSLTLDNVIDKAQANLYRQLKQAESELKTEKDKEKIKSVRARINDLNTRLKNLDSYTSLLRTAEKEAGAYVSGKLQQAVSARVDKVQKFLSDYGVQVNATSGEAWYYDDDGNALTEEQANEAKKAHKTVHKGNENAYTKGWTVFISQALERGRVPMFDGKGVMITKKIGYGSGEVSPERAVDILIGHELVHFIKNNASGKAKELYREIIDKLKGTKYDNTYEFGKRKAKMEISTEAEERYNKLRNLYISAEMQNNKLERTQAEARVNDDYIEEEFAADYMGTLFASDGLITAVNAQTGFFRRVWEWLTRLGKRYKADGNARSKRVDVLSNRLLSAVDRALKHENNRIPKQQENVLKAIEMDKKAKEARQELKQEAKQARAEKKAAQNAQKSTETDENTEGEETVAEDGNGAENGKAGTRGGADGILRENLVRFSLSPETDGIVETASDADYLSAVENGDMEKAQRMVDEAAKAAGYSVKAYHGTPHTEFTVFDKERVGKGNDQYGAGFYFATSKDAASHYGGRVINSALDIKNPIRITATGESGRNLIDAEIELTSEQAYEVVKRHPYMYDDENSPLGDYFDSYWEDGAEDWMIESLAEQYRDVGYLDSDLFRNYPNELHEALHDVVGWDGVEVTFETTGDKFYVAWFNNQMKSTDPVTYDDNGNVIPLSERFNEGNEDIRWSISSSLDSDIDSVLNGTFDASRNEVYLGQTSQFMTDVIGANALLLYMPASKVYSSLVTREEYNKKPYYAEQDHYHGIGKEDFIDILERSEKPIAAFAAAPDEKGNERLNRIVLVTDKIIKDAETGEKGYAVVVEEVDSIGRNQGKTFKANKAITVYERTHLLADIQTAIVDGRLLAKTKKGEHLLNMRRGSNPQATIREDVLKKNIANFWANVKWNNQKNKSFSSSTSPTTTAMEDAIKNSSYYKSMQNSKNDTDSRSSVSEIESETEQDERYLDLVKRTKEKIENNDKLSGELIKNKSRIEDGASVLNKLRQIIEAYGSTASIKDVDELYKKAFGYVYRYGGKDSSKATERFREVARLIYDGSVNDELRDTLKQIRGYEIRVPEDVKAKFENYGEFYKNAFGKLTLRNEGGESISEVYQKLIKSDPTLFPDDLTDPVEQLQKISDVANGIRGELNSRKYEDIERDVIEKITEDLITATADMDATTIRGYGDNASAKSRYNMQINKLREMIKQQNEEYKAKISAKDERQKAAYEREMVYKRALNIARALISPTKKHHIPEKMRNDVAWALRKIAIPKTTVKGIQIGNEISLGLGTLDIGGKSDGNLPASVLQYFKDHTEKIDVGALDSEQLHELSQMLKAIDHEINYQDKLYHSSASASETALSAMRQIEVARKIDGEVRKRFGGLANWLGMSAWDPEGLFQYIGIPELYQLYRRLADGQNAYADALALFTDELSNIVHNKENKKGQKISSVPKEWREEAVNIKVDSQKEAIQMTRAQIMSLYLLSKQTDSLKRILDINGGIRLTKKKVAATKVKGSDVKKAIGKQTTLGDSIIITQNDLDTIFSEKYLTDDMKAVADGISNFLNSTVKDKLNEVSLLLDGYQRFNVNAYFPMLVADADKQLDYDGLLQQQMDALKTGKSFTFDRTGTSGVTLVVDDVFDVVDRHILGASQYIGFEAGLRDFLKVYNGKYGGTSLKDELGNRLGKAVTEAVDNFIKGVEGKQMQAGGDELITEKLFSNYKAAAVALNLSVVAKQPMSIIRAMPEFSSKGIKAMLKPPGKAAIDEMVRESGLAKMKSWGFSENTTSKSVGQLYDRNSLGWKNKMNELPGFNLAEKADMYTWAMIWQACKAETDTIEQAVDKFNDVIRKTQVVNTAFTSSPIANKGFFHKMVFAFKNEPLKTFNYTRSALHDFIAGKEGSGKHLAKVLFYNGLNSAAVAAITAAFSMLRDEEDDDLLTIGDRIKENMIEDLISTMTIFLGDLAPAVKTAFDNRTVERADLSVITDTVQYMKDLYNGNLGSKSKLNKYVFDGSKLASSAVGIPVSNVLRVIKTGLNSFSAALDDPSFDYALEKIFYNVDSNKSRARFKEILTDALNEDYAKYADIKNDLLKHGYGQKEIDDAVDASDRFVKSWNEGPNAFREEVSKAQKYDSMFKTDYVINSLRGHRDDMITKYYNAILGGNDSLAEKEKNKLLEFRNPDTYKMMTERAIDDLVKEKLERAVKSDVKNKLVVGYGTAQWDAVVDDLLEKYKNFEEVDANYIDRIAKNVK